MVIKINILVKMDSDGKLLLRVHLLLVVNYYSNVPMIGYILFSPPPPLLYLKWEKIGEDAQNV